METILNIAIMSVSSPEPSASTIPKWPSSCKNVTNVYKNCHNMSKAWTDDWKELMPDSITEHEGAVSCTSDSLCSLFDVSWGGKEYKYFYVYIYDHNGDPYRQDGFDNPQRVGKGEDAEPPNTTSEDSEFDSDLYTYGWSESLNNIQKDTRATRTYTNKTFNGYFYSLYKRECNPSDETIQPQLEQALTGVDAIIKTKPTTKVTPPIVTLDNDHVKGIGWTKSSGVTESTSGNLLDDSFFNNITEDFTVYYHTYTDKKMHVTFNYYNDDVAVKVEKSVDYNSYVTPPDVGTRTGYDFVKWEMNGNEVDFLKLQITDDFVFDAVYQKKDINVYFVDGYRGVNTDIMIVKYMDSIDPTTFSTKYGLTTPTLKYYGWEDSPEKYQNVTQTQYISSLYVSSSMIDTDVYMYTNDTAYTVSGMISNGMVEDAEVLFDEESASSYSADDYVYDGNVFSFNLKKEPTAPVKDVRSFDVNIKDARGLEYTTSFNLSANFSSITAIMNKKDGVFSWDRNAIRGDAEIDANSHESQFIPNPDDTKYLGLIESAGNWHEPNSWTKMRVKFKGYRDFSIFVMNCGENNCDFPMISNLNTSFASKPVTSDAEVYDFVPNQTLLDEGDITIDSFKKITFSGLNIEDEYFFDIAYVKDSALDDGTDRAYVLFNTHENIYTTEPNVIYVSIVDTQIDD